MTETAEQTATELRARIVEALNTVPAKHVPAGFERTEVTHGTEHNYHGGCALCRGETETLADAVLAVFDDQAAERVTAEMWERVRLRELGFRNGTATMELTEAQQLAAGFVAAGRVLLDGSENYTELAFNAKVAESPQTYVFTVRRAEGLTPHQLREKAEAELDALREHIAADCERRAGYYDHPEIWLPDSQSPDAIAARAMQQAWATAARLIRAGEIPAELIQAASSDIGDEDGAQ